MTPMKSTKGFTLVSTGKSARGFTLIELLVVIAIIGILSSVVLASLNSARKKGRDARRIADIKQLQLALELSYDANNTYPLAINTASVITPGYISTIPTDPSGSAASPISYFYASANTDGTACASTPCASYVLGATLEVTNSAQLNVDIDGTVAAIACADPVYCARP